LSIEKYLKKLENIENHLYWKNWTWSLYIQSNCLLCEVNWGVYIL